MTTNLYALIESRVGHENFGKPFYIGIGTAKRPRKHFAEANGKGGHRNWRLHEVLMSHRAAGIAPEIQIIGTYSNRADACAAERREIAKWGRTGIEEGGILCNLASGGQGPDSELMQMPEIRKRNSEAQKRRPRETFENAIAAGRLNAKDEAINALRSTASTAANNRNWSDPEVRARRVAGMRGKKKQRSEASDQARRENAKKAQSPEARAKRSEELRRRWADPAYKERLAAKKREAWQDPEKRARMMAPRTRSDGPGEVSPEVGVVEREAVHDSSQP